MALDDRVPSVNELRGTAAAAAVASVMFVIVSIGSGAGFSIESVFIVFTLLLLAGFFTRQSADYTLGFVLVTVGLLLVLADYVLPGYVVSPFGFIMDLLGAIMGIDLSQIESWQFFVVSVAFVGIVIGARVRYSGAGKYVDTVFDRVLREFLKYADNYATMGRSLAIFFLGVVFIFAEQIASVAGVAGDRIAQVPFVASNFILALAGYASLGGDVVIVDSVPLFGTLSALDFLVFSIIVIAVAAGTRYDASGSLGRLVGRN